MSNYHNVLFFTSFLIVDGKSAAIDPDEFCNRVMQWHKNKRMENLMKFLSHYVHHVHSDHYFRILLPLTNKKKGKEGG